MKSKKLSALICAAVMLMSLTACGGSEGDKENPASKPTSGSSDSLQNEASSDEAEESGGENAPTASKGDDTSYTDCESAIEALDAAVKNEVDSTISALQSEYEQLKAETDTYEKYLNNVDKVKSFYAKIEDTTGSLCKKVCGYAADYAELINNPIVTESDHFDVLDAFYDSIYAYASDEIFFKISDGIVSDLYSDHYFGVINAAEESADPDEWEQVSTNEYNVWYATSENVRDTWDTFSTNVYDFYSEIYDALLNDELDIINGKAEAFRKNNA